MPSCIDKPRFVCALGAFKSVLAINGAVPILHAGPGCAAKLDGAIGTYNGCQGSGHVGSHILPCTNIGEGEVIFGGADKLELLIENALKVYDADLFVVMTGCIPEIVGDDIRDVVSKFSGADKPVLFAETAGFKGSNIDGHEILLDAIARQFLKPSGEIAERRINVWAGIPFYHPFWAGDLLAVEKLLRELGLEPNVIFSPDGDVESLNKIPSARFNLLVSPWVGLDHVRYLKDQFNTPYLHFPNLPVGPTETGLFLRKVGAFTGIAEDKVEEVIGRNEKRYYYFIERAADELLKTRLLPRRFIVTADASYALGISKFLVNDMGMIPETQFITDGTPEESRDDIIREFSNFNGGIKAEVEFALGSGYVQERIRSMRFSSPPLILGSGWEKTFSKEIGSLCIPIATPLLERMTLSRTYAGYDGALTLVEDICTAVLGSYQ
jgi:nitrogenase molybdenum-iron protein beta chain